MDGTTRDQLLDNGGIMLASAVMYLLLIIVFRLVAWLARLDGSRAHLFQAAMVFGNAGFLGIPLVMALYPDHGAVYVALMSIVDQALMWTYGVWLCEPVGRRAEAVPMEAASGVTGDAADGPCPNRRSAKPGAAVRALAMARRFVNPAFVSVLLSLAVILTGLPVPDRLLAPMHTVGSMATPMSMIYLGGLFAMTRWWGVLRRHELYLGIAVKMVVFPLTLYAMLDALAAAAILPLTHDMVVAVTLIAGLPTMTAVAMFAGRRDNMPDYATGFVLVSTLCSLATLTFVSALIL